MLSALQYENSKRKEKHPILKIIFRPDREGDQEGWIFFHEKCYLNGFFPIAFANWFKRQLAHALISQMNLQFDYVPNFFLVDFFFVYRCFHFIHIWPLVLFMLTIQCSLLLFLAASKLDCWCCGHSFAQVNAHCVVLRKRGWHLNAHRFISMRKY